MRRLTVANMERCRPPLDADEVARIAASAWQGKAPGFAKLPHSLVDGAAFRTLPDAGKVAMLALTRKHNGANNGSITLTRSEAKAWGLSRHKRTAGLNAAEAAELIECTARGKSASPGYRATPDRFRLLFLP